MSHYVYIAEDADGNPLYVGMSRDPRRRMGGHAKAPWRPLMVNLRTIEYPDRATALDAEAETVRELQPQFNTYLKGEHIVRPKVTPPRVTIRTVRIVRKLTLDRACELASERTGEPLTRGALSAIESGTRGVSEDVLRGLAHAYGIPVEAFILDYELPAREQAAA